ncbi:MAG TPA: DUF6766 family protein [Thermoanaerobaculia bacterium]|nr:DUF6766 family protein [Thermoanaerobaculia bacterium]
MGRRLLTSSYGHVYSEEEREHGSTRTVTTLSYMAEPQFWYESFQNWQSEFLAVLSIVGLSIWLRQWGSHRTQTRGGVVRALMGVTLGSTCHGRSLTARPGQRTGAATHRGRPQ